MLWEGDSVWGGRYAPCDQPRIQDPTDQFQIPAPGCLNVVEQGWWWDGGKGSREEPERRKQTDVFT
jgi:hypothetical protein